MTVAEPLQVSKTVAARDNRPLNVLMVTDHLGYAGGIIHGASRYYLNVLPRLNPAHVNVHLCILGGPHPFAEALAEAGVRPIFFSRAKWDPRAMSDLARLIRRLDVDVLHCLAMKGCMLGRIAARSARIPALIHLHDTNDPGLLIGFLQQRLSPWTARALAVSDAVRTFTIDRLGVPPRMVETLHNGLDVDHFATAAPGSRERIRTELGLAPNHFAVILAGRIVEGKGQRLMISLLPRILQRAPDARLVIVGDGPDLPACRALAGRCGARDAVIFTGQRADMPEVLAAGDAAVMPSLVEEGFGYAALEAAAAGLPVVAFDSGALHSIIDDGRTGFIAPRGDSEALVAALLNLATNPELSRNMGHRATRHARRFDIHRHIRRLEAIYSELAQPRTQEGR